MFIDWAYEKLGECIKSGYSSYVHFVTRMDRVHWYVAFALLVVFGFVLLKSSNSRRSI